MSSAGAAGAARGGGGFGARAGGRGSHPGRPASLLCGWTGRGSRAEREALLRAGRGEGGAVEGDSAARVHGWVGGWVGASGGGKRACAVGRCSNRRGDAAVAPGGARGGGRVGVLAWWWGASIPLAMLGGSCLSWGWGYRCQPSVLRPGAAASLLGARSLDGAEVWRRGGEGRDRCSPPAPQHPGRPCPFPSRVRGHHEGLAPAAVAFVTWEMVLPPGAVTALDIRSCLLGECLYAFPVAPSLGD